MKKIQLKELQRAITFIESLGCEFAIVTPNGVTFTNGLEVTKPSERRRAPLRHAYGAIASFYKPQIDLDAQIGSVQEVVYGNFAPGEIRGGVTSYLSKQWGNGTYTIATGADCLEILRTA